jgi:O-antigen ligase
MAERLTFNLGRGGNELPDRVEWVTAPAHGTLSDAAAPYLPPVERPNWGFWGVFAFTALLFFRPQDTVPALAPLHLPEIAAIGALIAMIGHRVSRGVPIVRFTPELVGVLAMAAVMLGTMPFSVWPGGVFETFSDIFIKVVLVFILTIQSIKAVRTLRWFTWLILCAMGYSATRGVLDYLRGINLIQGERLHGSISGLMGNPNDLAMNMVTFLPFAAVIAISRVRTLPRLMASFFALMMIATVLFTKSRAGLLGLAMVIAVLVIEGRKIRRGIGMAALASVLVMAPLAPSWFWKRVESITNPAQDESGSRQARKDLMREAFQTFLDHPLTGVGAGQFKNYNPPGRLEPWREAHNVILQIGAELGLFGLMAFLYLLWLSIRSVLWLRRMFGASMTRARPPDDRAGKLPVTAAFRPDELEWMRMHSVALSASLAGWIVCAQFASVGYYWTFYYLFALIVAGRELSVERIAAAHAATRPHPGPRPLWRDRLSA